MANRMFDLFANFFNDREVTLPEVGEIVPVIPGKIRNGAIRKFVKRIAHANKSYSFRVVKVDKKKKEVTVSVDGKKHIPLSLECCG